MSSADSGWGPPSVALTNVAAWVLLHVALPFADRLLTPDPAHLRYHYHNVWHEHAPRDPVEVAANAALLADMRQQTIAGAADWNVWEHELRDAL